MAEKPKKLTLDEMVKQGWDVIYDGTRKVPRITALKGKKGWPGSLSYVGNVKPVNEKI